MVARLGRELYGWVEVALKRGWAGLGSGLECAMQCTTGPWQPGTVLLCLFSSHNQHTDTLPPWPPRRPRQEATHALCAGLPGGLGAARGGAARRLELRPAGVVSPGCEHGPACQRLLLAVCPVHNHVAAWQHGAVGRLHLPPGLAWPGVATEQLET